MVSIVEQMLDSGFEEYKSSLSPENVSRSYQKEVKNKNGIKYFIQCQEWDWSTISNYPSNLERFSYQFDVQFTLSNGKTFDVNTVGWENKTLLEIEEFFEKVWKSMNCRYYERYSNPLTKWRQRDIEEQIAEEKNAQK
jgi:hypothetical protein